MIYGAFNRLSFELLSIGFDRFQVTTDVADKNASVLSTTPGYALHIIQAIVHTVEVVQFTCYIYLSISILTGYSKKEALSKNINL